MAARSVRWLAAPLLLAACSSPPPDPSVVTADEERQLNEAAATLDADVDRPDDPRTENAE